MKPHFFKLKNLPFTVDGGWGEWNAWESCPVTCGGGNQTRIRTCDNPKRTAEGYDCTVDGSMGSDSQSCNESPCPSKYHKYFQSSAVIFVSKLDCMIRINKYLNNVMYALS